jgi:hypothetical protein
MEQDLVTFSESFDEEIAVLENDEKILWRSIAENYPDIRLLLEKEHILLAKNQVTSEYDIQSDEDESAEDGDLPLEAQTENTFNNSFMPSDADEARLKSKLIHIDQQLASFAEDGIEIEKPTASEIPKKSGLSRPPTRVYSEEEIHEESLPTVNIISESPIKASIDANFTGSDADRDEEVAKLMKDIEEISSTAEDMINKVLLNFN